MRNKFFIIILILILSLNKSEGQGIKVNSFKEISLTFFFKSEIGFESNYLINDYFGLGGAYQHVVGNYVNETKGSRSISGYTTTHSHHSIFDIYEINFILMTNKKNKKISFGVGVKPGIQYHFGKKTIASESYICVCTKRLNTIKINDLYIYNSGVFYTRFNNILTSNFSFEINLQLGVRIGGHYSKYDSLFEHISPFSRFNAGLIYKFKNKVKNKKTL